MVLRRVAGALALTIGTVGLVSAGASTPVRGYLDAKGVDLIDVVPPAPIKGDIRYSTDRAVFRSMRLLVGSPRWRLAEGDIPVSPAAVLSRFSCAAGIDLSASTTPATYRLIERVATDVAAANNRLKEHYHRQRPFMIDRGQTCQPQAELNSYDYPSGHTSRGWAIGTVLAELIPDRSLQLLSRAKAYGESRMVCRVHNASAVEAGRLSASATLTVLRSDEDYRADVEAAKREIAELGRRGERRVQPAAMCLSEAEVLRMRLYR